MSVLIDNFVQIIIMLALLLLSALFSGSETAFFNLSHNQLYTMKKSRQRSLLLTALLMQNPKKFLTSLLLGNMAVNVLFFAFASILSVNLQEQAGAPIGIISAVLCFFSVLLFGEMLPKSFAYSHSQKFCQSTAIFCYLVIKVLNPLIKVFEYVVTTPLLRLILGRDFYKSHTKSTIKNALTVKQFQFLIESSKQQGTIDEGQTRVLSSVAELGFLKVRHLMKHRVDLTLCEIRDSRETIIAAMHENKLTSIPIYEESIDTIKGLLFIRDLLLNPTTPIDHLIQDPVFVPEQKSAESLLDFFRSTGRDIVFVVDEYGGFSGIISLEDLIREVIVAEDSELVMEPVEQIGPLCYRLAGNLAIHDWAAVFGLEPVQERITTLGGAFIAMLDRIPKTGDTVHIKNLTLQAENVQKNRVYSLILSLDSGAAGEDEIEC